ncbi:MAG TPA: NfeD family protein [Phycisphaerae bacterium]|nr:NfeD family protein [Phycisphaerae bacterium]HUT59035.1 NfeD family protein [Phycisphaerae bacterium]
MAGTTIDGNRVTPEGWFAPAKPTEPPPELPKPVTRCFVLPIQEEISEKTFQALRRKALRCRAAGAELIVLDMDTWGGRVDASLDIARLIKRDLADIRVVCYARTRAVSGGALVALACHEIVVDRAGKLGDCAPLLLGGKLEGVEREKIETVLRAEFEESARFRGYSTALAMSMVSYDLEVWLVRHKVTHELRYVLEQDWRGRVDIPPGVASAPSNPGAEWELLRVIVHKGKLPTWSPSRAVEYGFARQIISPRGDPLRGLLQAYGVTREPTILKDTWSEKLVGFLSSSGVLALLFVIGLLAIYAELHTPGFGVAGTIAIVCFAVAFGARYLTGLANWWEVSLFVIGLILIAVEVFVIPGFGVAGVLGILCCLAGLLGMLIANPPDKLPIPKTDLDWGQFLSGLFALGAAFVLAVAGMFVLSRYLPKVPVASRLVLKPVGDLGDTTLADESPMRAVRPGDMGVVEGTCRPAGKVRFGEHLVDATSQGAIIEAGARVRALGREGNRVVVEKA